MSADRLQVSNNWQHLSYTFRGRSVSDSKPAVVTVRWPDGTEEDRPIAWRYRDTYYYDHGNRHDVRQAYPEIEIDHHGATAIINLMRVDIVEIHQ